VDIPSTFLGGPSPAPIVAKDVPFKTSDVPEYNGSVAVILDNVISPEECKQLIALAEDSVPRTEDEDAAADFSAWKPAMVSSGVGTEFMDQSYRNSDRIVWDEQTIVDRLWERCMDVPQVKEAIARVNKINGRPDGKWVFHEPNKRMRFLKYSKGQFFKRTSTHSPMNLINH
jgi:hypothetical protein